MEEKTETYHTRPQRDTWSSKVDYILTCVGWCVGLGNVWRFPYVCYQNGGGAFLIPYVIFLVCCAIPVLCLESFIGQYSGLGVISCWGICPLLKGIGYAATVFVAIAAFYYIYVLVLGIYYFAASFSNTLPWTQCGNSWNTPYCRERSYTHNTSVHHNISDGAAHSAYYNNVSASSVYDNATRSPSEEYFRNRVLRLTDGIDDIGDINWLMVACLALAWTLIAIINIKGIKSAGKVVYFTATFPYVMLTILVIRGCTLEGSMEGISFYLYPKWDRLLDCKVWYSAALQLFYSAGPGQGIFISLASHNKFHNPCIKHTIATTIVNCCTSFYAGFAVFSVLGYMAHQLNVPVSEVVSSGPGLAFVVYPQALSTLPFAPFWSVSFFFMIILLGIDTELVNVETVVTCLKDEFPALDGKRRKYFLNFAVVAVLFLCGLIFVTDGGFYIFTLIDWYCAAFVLFAVSLTECVLMTWIYGLKNLNESYRAMFGHSICPYFRICWFFVSPCFITVVVVFSIIYWTPVELGEYTYPPIARVFGWLIVLMTLAPVPILAIYRLCVTEGSSITEKIQQSLKPSAAFQQHIKTRITEAEIDLHRKSPDEPLSLMNNKKQEHQKHSLDNSLI